MKKIIIFDFNRTLYDPDTVELVVGAIELLDVLRARKFEMHLVSRIEGGREDILEKLGIKEYFSQVHFVSEKTPELFKEIIELGGGLPSDTYVVGDYLQSEIKSGNACGAKTMWFKSGLFANHVPHELEEVPWRTIHSLSEITMHL